MGGNLSEPRDYIFFADDRSSIPTSTMHIADQIAQSNDGANRIFWVNIYTRLPKLQISEFKKAWKILQKTANGRRQTAEEKMLLTASATPPQFPWFGNIGRMFNGYCAGRFYKRFVKKHNIRNPVLITNFPCVADAFKAIRKVDPAAKQIYYCFDDFIEYPGFNPKHWRNMEQAFFNTVDGVIFTSRDLQTKKQRPASLPDLYLPHGVDYKHFAEEETAKEQTAAVSPSRLRQGNEKPFTVGFFGTIDTWVDISVIAYLAKRFPQCSFNVIGRAVVPLTVFDGIGNIRFLGQVPYTELPKYAQSFDAGLIPFVLNDLTMAVNPLKLMEYYAMGIPVISTRLPDILDAPGPIYFADTHEEFGNRLEEILRADLSVLRQQAQEAAMQNSWSARAEQLVRFAEEL